MLRNDTCVDERLSSECVFTSRSTAKPIGERSQPMAEATSHLVIFIGGWGVEEYIQTLFQKCAWNQGLAEKGCNCLWMPQEGSKANPLPLMRQGPWV